MRAREPGARGEEGRAEPEGSADEAAQGVDPGVAEGSARLARGTKMPTFRLDDDEIRAIAAFIWQSGVQGTLPQQKPGDPEKGKEAFETRGCMACHSMGEGGQKQGGTFAANLSREGEKANYDYLVRWVHNPRQRTAALLPVREEGPHGRGLPAARPAVRVRPGTHPSAPTTATSCRCSR